MLTKTFGCMSFRKHVYDDMLKQASSKRANKSMFDVYPLCSPFSRTLFLRSQQLNVANMVCFLKRMMEKKPMSRSCKK